MFTSEGAQYSHSGGATEGKLPDGTSHGQLVSGPLKQTLTNDPQLKKLTNPDTTAYGTANKPGVRATTVWQRENDKIEIVVVDVDTHEYRTQEIIDRLKSLVSSMKASSKKIDRFVINMRFVVIPCPLLLGIDLATATRDAIISAYRLFISEVPYLGPSQQTFE